MNIWAHRGCSQRHPENTIESFTEAIRTEVAIGIELDIQLTKDGKLVVIHDERVDRTTNGIGFVRDFTLSELKNLAIWTGNDRIERIPTMEEVLDLLETRMRKGFLLNIELKTSVYPYSGIEEKIVDLVHDRGLQDSVVYSSFSAKSLMNLAKVDSEAKLGVLDAKVSDCLVKAKGLEYMLGKPDGSIALHPYWKEIDLAKEELENRTVRAWFSGHLFPEKPTGTKMDMSKHADKGITDVFINEPEVYGVNKV